MYKKFMKPVWLLGLAILLLSCTPNSFKSQKTRIQMEGNPTTGYTWIYQIEDEGIISISEKIEAIGKKGLMGVPSLFTYTIQSLKEGSTKVHFEYKRSWEDLAPIEEKDYEVEVDSKGKIMIKNLDEKIEFTSVSMKEGLKLMAKDSSYILLDVRRADEYAAGHIPGALLLTNETMTEEDTALLLPDKEQTIYVYCRSGRRSKLASQKLIDYGYRDVIEIGGIIEYKGKIESE